MKKHVLGRSLRKAGEVLDSYMLVSSLWLLK